MGSEAETVLCDAELCEGDGVETVNVSVGAYADEERHYCSCCHEVYATGVQHGVFMAMSDPQAELVKVVRLAGARVLAANEPTPPILPEGQSHTDDLYELCDRRGMADTVERAVEIIEGLEHDTRILKARLDAATAPTL